MREAFLDLFDADAGRVFEELFYATHERERALELTEQVFSRAWDRISCGALSVRETLEVELRKVLRNERLSRRLRREGELWRRVFVRKYANTGAS